MLRCLCGLRGTRIAFVVSLWSVLAGCELPMHFLRDAPQPPVRSPSAGAVEPRVTEQIRVQRDALQARVEALLARERGQINRYHLRKAAGWVGFADEAALREDRIAADEALEQAASIARDVFEGKTLSLRTWQIRGVQRVRLSWWREVEDWKEGLQQGCAGEALAEFEIGLMRLGYVQFLTGETGAAPVLKEVEAQREAARQAAADCARAQVAQAEATQLRKHRLPIEMQRIRSADLFRPGSALLERDAQRALDALATRLKTTPLLFRVRIVGHADRHEVLKPRQDAKRLSLARAQALQKALVSRGVDARLIALEAMGDRQPLAKCPTKQAAKLRARCEAKNRRVELELERLLPNRLPDEPKP